MYCGNTTLNDMIVFLQPTLSFHNMLSRVQMKLTNLSAPNGCPWHSSVERAVSPGGGGEV